MAIGYRVTEPSGKLIIMTANTRDELRNRVEKEQEKWDAYCDRNWLNDTGDLYSPETKIKRFLDSLAYCLMIGNTKDIETDYKKVMHAKREIPASSCPSFIDNMLYASGGATDKIDIEECAGFDVMIKEIDERAEKYETSKQRKWSHDDRFTKFRRLGIIGGEWCRVDTEGVFMYLGKRYMIDPCEAQYQPVETEFGLLYDMDRILAVGEDATKFYDMNYDEVKVRQL